MLWSSPSKVAVIGGSCLAALLCFICYWNSLSGDLVHDDIFAIRDNKDVKDTPLFELFKNDFWGKPVTDPTSHKSYRPLTVLSFRLNFAIHELRPWGYHLVNVLLHTICTLLVYTIGTQIIFYSDHHSSSSSYLSLQTAVLFAVHPIHTEAVSGVVGRADILACLFFLMSLLSYHNCILEVKTVRLVLKLFLSLFLGCCAMLCKEHGVTVLGIALIYELFIIIFSIERNGSRIVGSSVRVVIRITLLCVVTGTLLLFRMWALHGTLPQFTIDDNPASFSKSLTTRFLTYTYLYYFNAKLLLVPTVLSYDWQMGSIPLIESLTDLRNINTLVFFVYLFGLIATVLFSSKISVTHRLIIFLGTTLTVVPFLPASNIFLRVGFVVAERVMYISSIGSCVLIVYGLKLLNDFMSRKYKSLSNVRSFFFVFIVVMFSLRTIDRNSVWQTRESLFRSGVLALPHNAKAHYNYGNYLKDQGLSQQAIYHYKEALTLSPDHSSSHNNVATLLNGTEALHHYRQAIRHNPQHFKAYFNLGNYMWNHNELFEAEKLYVESIRLNPKYTDAMIKLSSLYVSMEKYKESELLVEQTLTLSPKEPGVLHNCGMILMATGQLSKSISLLNQALAFNPLNSDVMTGLARAYRLVEQNKEAENLFIRSLSISPRASVYQSLGGLYFNTGRFKESYVMFKSALEMEPNNSEYICNYVQACRSLEMIDDIEKLIEMQPSVASLFCVHFNYATLLMKHKPVEVDKALSHSSRAISLGKHDKELYDAYTLHGTLLKDAKNLSQSAKSFKEAVDLYPETASSWVNLGAVMHMMGDYDEARKYYERAVSIDPNNTIVKANLQKLKRLLQKG